MNVIFILKLLYKEEKNYADESTYLFMENNFCLFLSININIFWHIKGRCYAVEKTSNQMEFLFRKKDVSSHKRVNEVFG